MTSTRTFAALLLTALLGLSTGACTEPDVMATTTPEAYRAGLLQALPLGSQIAVVTAHLDRQGIEHSPYDTQSRSITAIHRNVSQSGWVSRSLSLDFRFDAGGKLSAVTVENVFTGP